MVIIISDEPPICPLNYLGVNWSYEKTYKMDSYNCNSLISFISSIGCIYTILPMH